MLRKDAIEIMLKQMDLWYQSELGSYLLEIERAELDKHLPHYFGEHLLQIGGPSETFLFENAAIKHRIRLSPEHASVFRGPSVQGSMYEIPFLAESMDVVLLPHILELTQHTTEILSECHRIMTPEGRLIILGFNPCSLWGMKKYLGKKKALPWRAHFKMKSFVQHALLKQGFDLEYSTTMVFEPPMKNRIWLKKLFPMEAMGRVCWPDWGAVYMIIARKHVLSPLLMPSIEALSS